MMSENKFELLTSAVEMSETATYLELTSRICYYGEPNYNGVALPVEDAEDRAQTLVHQPVVAKYKVCGGQPDLGGHELHYNSEGKPVFGTENVGTHISVEVREDTVPVNGVTKTLPCLFATYRIWKRNENVVAAVKRLFNEKRLYGSWELLSYDYEERDNVKFITSYVFTSNALLGTGHQPAYGEGACALSIASADETPEAIIAEALAKDIKLKGENNMPNDTTLTAASVTIDDRADSGVAMTTTVIPSEDSSMAEKLVELSTTIANLTAEVEAKNTALVAANEKITALEASVAELTKYKDICEQAEAEKLAAEMQEKIAQLKSKVEKSGLFDASELAEGTELSQAIEKADEVTVKSMIADKVMKSLEQEPAETEPVVQSEQAEIEATPTPKADVAEDDHIDNKQFMKILLG